MWMLATGLALADVPLPQDVPRAGAEERAARWRVALPPMDVGLAGIGRVGTSPAAAFELGVEPVQKGRFGARVGLRAAGSSHLGAVPGVRIDDGWWGSVEERRITRTAVDLAPRFRVVRGLNLELVGQVSWRTYRQQWTTVATQAMPGLGAGVSYDLKWAGVRLRGTTDLAPTRLVTEDGTSFSMSPLQLVASVFFRFPGTRDPFGPVPTLPVR